MRGTAGSVVVAPESHRLVEPSIVASVVAVAASAAVFEAAVAVAVTVQADRPGRNLQKDVESTSVIWDIVD